MGAEVEQRRVYVLFATPTYRKTNGIDLSIRTKVSIITGFSKYEILTFFLDAINPFDRYKINNLLKNFHFTPRRVILNFQEINSRLLPCATNSFNRKQNYNLLKNFHFSSTLEKLLEISRKSIIFLKIFLLEESYSKFPGNIQRSSSSFRVILLRLELEYKIIIFLKIFILLLEDLISRESTCNTKYSNILKNLPLEDFHSKFPFEINPRSLKTKTSTNSLTLAPRN